MINKNDSDDDKNDSDNDKDDSDNDKDDSDNDKNDSDDNKNDSDNDKDDSDDTNIFNKIISQDDDMSDNLNDIVNITELGAEYIKIDKDGKSAVDTTIERIIVESEKNNNLFD